ncbi:hypothetical protein [Yinghuangia sp. YIM S10712]|uniref:hypothetical protein n=1 Tax=Yinghuangia sp. YIM S10712 TaxID=3436930 RepID=UPI003F533F87
MTTFADAALPHDHIPPEDTADAVLHGEADAPDTVTVYSAELQWQEGRYVLIVHDHLTGTVQTTRVAGKAVDKLPAYLAMLDRPGR